MDRDIVNIDFLCKYQSGVLTTSEESEEVGWFTKEQATEMITHPLYIPRFENMINNNKKFYCSAFNATDYLYDN